MSSVGCMELPDCVVPVWSLRGPHTWGPRPHGLAPDTSPSWGLCARECVVCAARRQVRAVGTFDRWDLCRQNTPRCADTRTHGCGDTHAHCGSMSRAGPALGPCSAEDMLPDTRAPSRCSRTSGPSCPQPSLLPPVVLGTVVNLGSVRRSGLRVPPRPAAGSKNARVNLVPTHPPPPPPGHLVAMGGASTSVSSRLSPQFPGSCQVGPP